ncbi:MAG: VanW family protein [Sandaracinaceae bacterium]|nr:VanW family protein [Sandaracinaceae bacterium]
MATPPSPAARVAVPSTGGPAAQGGARAPRRFVPAALALALAALAAYGAHALRRFEARTLTLDGVALPEGDPAPFVRQLARDWYDTELSIDAGTTVVRASRRELGARLDVARAIREIRAARGAAPLWTRALAMAAGHDGRFTWSFEVSEERVRAFTEELRRRTAVEPIPIDRESEGEPGATIELAGATRAITAALSSGALVTELPVRRIAAPEAPIRSQRLARFTEVVSSYQTRYGFGGDLFGRATNIELAASRIDGARIAAGQELSFNELVGERSFERGFMPAVELARGGRRTEGIGGGICQVAATLHAAAFFGGLEILEHHPHTRESSYIEPGLDAAVSWPSRDVRIRNPHSFPLRVDASAYRGVLRIALMGAARAPHVEWSTRVISRVPRGVEREVDRNLPLGTETVLDEGEDGSLLERVRTVHWASGPATERVELRYPVVHRLVRAGPTEVGEP